MCQIAIHYQNSIVQHSIMLTNHNKYDNQLHGVRHKPGVNGDHYAICRYNVLCVLCCIDFCCNINGNMFTFITVRAGEPAHKVCTMLQTELSVIQAKHFITGLSN